MWLLIRALCVLLLFTSQAYAASCVSTQDGDWDQAATWTSCGGGTPGDGDTAEIDHAVTVDANVTVGTDGAATTYAIITDVGGSLTVDAGVTVTVKGGIWIYDGTLTNNGTLDFLITNDQRIYIGDNWQGDAKLIVKGTSKSSRAVLSNNASSTGTITILCRINASHPEYVDFEFVEVNAFGDATTKAFDCTANTAGDLISIKDTIWDGCGQIYNTYDPTPNQDFIIQRNTFKNCANSTSCFRLTSNSDKGAGTGTWLYDSNVSEGLVQFYNGRDFTITNNIFYDDVTALATSGDTWEEFSGNFIRSTNAFGYSFPGDTADNYYFLNNSSKTNPHYFQTVLGSSTHDGNVIEFDGANDEGDVFLIHAPSSSATITLQNNLILCGTGTNAAGTLFSALGGSNATIVANHNTFCVGSQGAAVGETYAGHAGMVSSFQSNIGFNKSGSSGYLMFDSGADDSVSDLISSSNFDYNVAYNLAGVENNLEFSSGTPNSNGWTSDPQFFDDTRNIADWDDSLGGAGTAANALSEMLLLNETGYDTNYSISALVSYVKDGFRVQNSDLDNAGHDSEDVGCCGYFSASPSPTPSTTPSATPSTTPSATPSTTPSATPSTTPSATPSTTPSATPSTTPSATPSTTPSASASPSVTPSPGSGGPAGPYKLLLKGVG